jgi:hypothetical protein
VRLRRDHGGTTQRSRRSWVWHGWLAAGHCPETRHSGEALGLAGIGQPVPAEHALSAHGEAVAIGFDQLEEVGEVVVLDVAVDQFLALAVPDADVHLVRVQINSAVVFGGG